MIGGVVGDTAGAVIGNKMVKQAQKIEEEIPGAVVERVDDGIVVTFDEIVVFILILISITLIPRLRRLLIN